MNKSEIKQKRTELVRTILEIEKLKVRKAALTKALAPDFEANEAEFALPSPRGSGYPRAKGPPTFRRRVG